MKCYFCHQIIPERKIETLKVADAEPILRIGTCMCCVPEDDIKTITIVKGLTDEVGAVHLYLQKDDHHYRLLLHLSENRFFIYHKMGIDTYENIIYSMPLIPNITPYNIRHKLPIILTFL